jgi:hypothetical protein
LQALFIELYSTANFSSGVFTHPLRTAAVRAQCSEGLHRALIYQNGCVATWIVF